MKPVACALLAILITGLALSCGTERPLSGPTPVDPALARADFLAAHQGETLVLLMGMEGCANTREATGVLASLARESGFKARLARLDVPPPGEESTPVEDWPHPYHYGVDADRTVAKRLGFFYYPTLFVIDGDGVVRYAGGCETGEVRKMVAEIAGEEPGAEKRIYTPPVPAVGTTAPAVRGRGPEGDDVDVWDGRNGRVTLVFFTSLGCPFSREAAEGLPELESEFGEEVLVAAVEKGSLTKAARRFYGKLDLAGPVVLDADGAISRAYGVEPVPFFFVVGEDGRIAERGPYTAGAARRGLDRALGLEVTETEGEEAPGAG
ncbi:MAG: redoxin domain-containing protein [Planctomycetota bacterium]|jgi:peroxiredoxin